MQDELKFNLKVFSSTSYCSIKLKKLYQTNANTKSCLAFVRREASTHFYTFFARMKRFNKFFVLVPLKVSH